MAELWRFVDEAPAKPVQPAPPEPEMWRFVDEAPPRPPERGVIGDLADSGNALATGFWKGAVNLAGMPLDSAINAWDLLKAGAGSAYIKATGKAPPAALELSDRKKVWGTSEWLMEQAKKTALTRSLVQAQNPEYEGGYLQALGSSLPGGPTKPSLNAARMVGLNAASALSGKAAADAGGDPEWAILAGLAPNAATMAAGMAARRAIVGNAAARQKMNERMATLENAGVRPSVGLATGNRLAAGVENILALTPGAQTIMGDYRKRVVDALQAKAKEAADTAAAGSDTGSLIAGRAIREGLKNAVGDFRKTENDLWDNKFRSTIPANTQVDISNYRRRQEELTALVPGAENISGKLNNPELVAILKAYEKDLAGTPAQTVTTNVLMPGAAGYAPVTTVIPGTPAKNTIPFGVAHEIRKLIGEKSRNANFTSDIKTKEWDSIYGPMTQDLEKAAANAGPAAVQAWKRANRYTRGWKGRMENLAPFSDQDIPLEDVFHRVEGTLGDQASVFQALKKTLPEGARGTVAATVINKLGRATPGQQNELGDVWSHERFLTNWNNLSQEGRQALLSGFPNSGQVLRDIGDVAKSSAFLRSNSREWANPSNTAATHAARVVLGGLLYGAPAAMAGIVPAAVPLSAAGILVGSNLGARTLTSKTVVDYLSAKYPHMPAAEIQDKIRALTSSGLLSPDQKPQDAP